MKMMIRSDALTLVLVNLASIMEQADESLLPAVYKEVGEELHVNPTLLGSLTLFRAIVQALCYPLAAYLSVRYNRANVIAAGAFCWAAATFLVAVSSTFAEVGISRGLNGIGLAMVMPAMQSLVADLTDESNRGTAFGWLQLTSKLGTIIGSVIAILIAPTSFLGIAGWRFAFHLVGLLSVLIGILVYFFAQDPRFSNSINGPATSKSISEELADLIKDTKLVIRVPSFRIIVAQGVAGSFPWSALSFAPMWLELMGFSNPTAAAIWALFSVSNALGALFGGKMGDVLSEWMPNSGRIILSQISTGSAIPLAAILLLGLPNDPSTALLHGSVFFITGFIISWSSSATNNPIFAEIVPEHARTSIYALDRMFESLLASFAPTVVGILAQQLFGYKPAVDSIQLKSTRIDEGNAASLGKALYTTISIPMLICCTIYSFLYCYYPRDRDQVRRMYAMVDTNSDVEGEGDGDGDEDEDRGGF